MTAKLDSEDLTARARIRDAAMRQFGEHGFDKATIRGIAEAAGVSSGLVRHHFGSKQALREACDAQLTKIIQRLDSEAHSYPTSGVPSPAAELRPYQRYMARTLTDGSARAVFDGMVALAEPWLAEADKSRPDPPDTDVRVRATISTAMAMAASVLHAHVSRGLGVDITTPEGERLLQRALVDIYSHPMLTLDEAAAIRSALDASASAPAPRRPRPRRHSESTSDDTGSTDDD